MSGEPSDSQAATRSLRLGHHTGSCGMAPALCPVSMLAALLHVTSAILSLHPPRTVCHIPSPCRTSVISMSVVIVDSLEELSELPAAELQQLTHLAFSDTFNDEIPPHSLPSSLIELSLGESFNHPLAPDSLPSSLQLLRLGGCFTEDEEIDNELPHQTKGGEFNQPLQRGSLPPSLLELQTGACFEKSIDADVLPPSLQRLTFHPLSRFQQQLTPGVPASRTDAAPHAELLQHCLPARCSASVTAAACTWASSTISRSTSASCPPLCSGSSSALTSTIRYPLQCCLPPSPH